MLTNRKTKTVVGLAALVGAVVQFLVFHLVVQAAWERPYSWADHNISDLGNRTCAVQAEPQMRWVCSPDHGMMNESFIRLGVLAVIGLLLSAPLWRPGARAARGLLLAAGLGWVLVGLAPADVNENVHVLGAALIMLAGNIGLIVAGRQASDPIVRRFGLPLGALGLTAFTLFLSQQYLGLGMGGMERVAVFPQLAWLVLFAVVGLRHLFTNEQPSPAEPVLSSSGRRSR
ncbi:hypothetical protein Kisp01_26760 [Kineosporia sp. NBRC 101677]|uniref:DUF998 domain-containing protein n=1 Tax=Kineosporia sp. NBRC 101677 TaxID=3032197 RepID=UPI0024A59DF0|nr:DUF998 domain-containing protein [Kineosporia sp. NBRC 101677]GLY15661.1 hypothetical protein Kisp01_26760 [Kineosporia sp. NBRC 101677]